MSVTQTRSEAMFINGEWTDGSSSNRIPVYDPSTEEVIAEIPDASAADVDAAVAAARHAFDEGRWPQTTAQERGRILFRIAEKIRAEAPLLTQQSTFNRLANQSGRGLTRRSAGQPRAGIWTILKRRLGCAYDQFARMREQLPPNQPG